MTIRFGPAGPQYKFEVVEMAKRISQLEAKRRDLKLLLKNEAAECARLAKAVVDAEKERDQLEAQCAAMREALQSVHRVVPAVIRSWDESEVYDEVRRALAPDAGKALLERLEKAESAVGSEAWNAIKARAQAFAECAEIARSFATCENCITIVGILEAKAGGT